MSWSLWTFFSLALLNDEAWGAGGADTDQIIAGGRVTSPDSQSEVTQDKLSGDLFSRC